MIINSAKFLTSALKPHQYPDLAHPEVAFVGPSNVGKSSLINSLVNQKHLVKTSSTPGRTQLINFFLVNNILMLVDLPGYGYAKVPLKIREKWGIMVDSYFNNRASLKAVVLIMDIRRYPRQQEFDTIQWLLLQKIPIIYVLTKTDKLSKNKLLNQLNIIRNKFEIFSINVPKLILFSAKTKEGCNDIWSNIEYFLF